MTYDNSAFHVKAGDFDFTFLNSGDISKATYKSMLINRLVTNSIDGAFNNLYLRVHRGSTMKVFPLLGVKSTSDVYCGDGRMIWRGTADAVQYEVTFYLSDQGIWFWDVKVSGDDVEIDIILGQDLGLALKDTVRTNEAYACQYIDHKVFEDENRGVVICSRQNQPQDGSYPYIQQGCLTKVIGYSTDGYQFFGLSYKETNQPEALMKSTLANEVYQYEFAYTALQSERKHLRGTDHIVFYGLFKEDHPLAVKQLDFYGEVEAAWDHIQLQNHLPVYQMKRAFISPRFGAPLRTIQMTREEVGGLFPRRHEEEWDGETLLSFFTDTHEHVVLKEKELRVERPHGHILMTGKNDGIVEDVLTSTSYMYGVFNSQLTVGNTSFHKMITNTRDALNIMKTSGQRIYIEMNGTYHLLTMPSMFELGFNYAKWYYKTEDDLIIVTNYTVFDGPEIRLNVCSTAGKSYRFLVTNQVAMNNQEYEVPFRLEFDDETVSLYAGDGSDSSSVYPKLCYRQRVYGTDIALKDENLFASNIAAGTCSLVVLELRATNEWTMVTQGLLHGEASSFVEREWKSEVERFRAFYQSLMNGFRLSQNGDSTDEFEKYNDTAWWYTHNMLVHFSVPHGLEQYGGAAWGTRDVCQGPTEYFLATQNYQTVRQILETVYTHQYADDGNWPQWFMFDKYHQIQQEDSHGDIIVWPIKALADYIMTSGDDSILHQEVLYTERGSFDFTSVSETILDHVKKQVGYIKLHFSPGTHLPMYGDGDWDDTLQPADAKLKKRLISSWTTALTYQALVKLSLALEQVDSEFAMELQSVASKIAEDFTDVLAKAGVVPGFVLTAPNGQMELMLHPSDEKTGIQYRLLPMLRSTISELFTLEQAEAHYHIIKKEMFFPDGVRLMNKPAQYDGGVSHYFKRAEQAANFGREIGLQYVHAHIRFIEAMAKLGKSEDVWQGLQIINPIGIKKVVPNAALRQSNTYFSSSDGNFLTRYEAQEQFDRLRTGTVEVKGGWRIYSSGPGIYMNQFISHALGIRFHLNHLVIDPVLPQKLDGLQFQFQVKGYPVVFVYHLSGAALSRVVINGQDVSTEAVVNKYRNAGLMITSDELDRVMTDGANVIDIFME